MIDMLAAGLAEVRTLILSAIAVAAAAYVAGVWWRTKALVPTLTAIAMSAVVVWAATNIDVLQAQVGEDSTRWIGAADPGGPVALDGAAGVAGADGAVDDVDAIGARR